MLTPGSRRQDPLSIDGVSLTLADVVSVARHGRCVSLSTDAAVRAPIEASFALNQRLIARAVPVYGVTTGFGDSMRSQISPDRAAQLQAHLIHFLGNGTGPMTEVDAARAVTLVRANCLARGHSAVRRELIERLVLLLNQGITPLIPEEGSVGASGDLVPLSYLAAVLLGERQVFYRGAVRSTRAVFGEMGISPLIFEPKEGLALVNGTAFMSGVGALTVVDAQRVALLADCCTAMATEVLTGISAPFDAFIHEVAKPHAGQVRSARNIRSLLKGSQLVRQYDEVVRQAGAGTGQHRELPVDIQDKYSLRCAPQYVGVLWDTLDWVSRWLEVEINSTNDNPLFDAATGRVLNGGNFSGSHVALAMDAVKVAVASVGDLIDRQLELLVDEKFNQGLTPNLIVRLSEDHPEYGLNHGFKGMQLACSSLAAEALNRCMPMTVFSRSTECHNQDKVSMGATAARQARDVVALVEKVIAIHLLALCQAADLRGADRLGRTHTLYELVRCRIPMVTSDREMGPDIQTVLTMIHDGSLTDSVTAGCASTMVETLA